MSDHNVQAIKWDGEKLSLLDQRLLPAQESWIEIADLDGAVAAIRDLVVRGAPAIGIVAAYAAVLGARGAGSDTRVWHAQLERLAQTRPTAVNLGWALARMRSAAGDSLDPDRLEAEARTIHDEDVAANRAMAELGSAVFESGTGVLTHCNTGSLATGGIGTALGVIVHGYRKGRITAVFADETRPWLQGSRLTAWECAREGIPCRVVVEAAVAGLMQSGQVDWVITGADRIAANGDVANKVGTRMLAILARHHGLGFMVVAPSSTLDPDCVTGADIPIEERDAGEIWRAAGVDTPPAGVDAWNPVFDITPAELVSVIVTEKGVIRPPFHDSLAALRAA